MTILKETSHYIIYWYDNNHDIIVGEVYAGWTWDDAKDGLDFLNTTLEASSKLRKTYAIIHLTTGAQLMPRGASTLLSLRELVSQDPEHEELTIYVTEVHILNTLMKLVTRLYNLADKISHYHFVSSVDDALQLIRNNQNADTT